MKAVFDTNILIDFLQGHVPARSELARYTEPSISIISWMEVLEGANAQTESATRAFLAGFEVLGIDASVAQLAVNLRRSAKIKLPDAVIWATAKANQCLLVTRNGRDMDPNDPGVRIPYLR
jgi:predicted nucleic acid-binding protein